MLGIDLSPTSRGRVIVVSVAVTLGCIALSFAVNSLGLTEMDTSRFEQQLVVNIAIPTVVAFPVMYFLMSKLRELAIAHQKLQVIASTDSLTAVLNRGAFTMLVEAYLSDARTQARELQGALLIIDADHFKTINDNFGHDRGDEALRIIAGAIQAVLRGADLLGRLGGEEFGVFLPGASPQMSQSVAERIRTSVNAAEFVPLGTERIELSVSVGGATFDRRVGFRELFRLADERLYAVKQQGRNRVSLAAIAPLQTAA